ncbi:MAG: hypothetical protein ACXWW0_09140, partial [Bacteroidia bacterium]
FKNPVTAEVLKTIPGVENAEKRGNAWMLRTDTKTDMRETIFRWSVEKNNVIYEMIRETQNLETIFQELTRQSN